MATKEPSPAPQQQPPAEKAPQRTKEQPTKEQPAKEPAKEQPTKAQPAKEPAKEQPAKEQPKQDPKKKQPSASPEPGANTRSTARTHDRSPSPAHFVGIPDDVASLSKLSAHERIEREKRASMEMRKTVRHPCFGSTAHRAVVEGPKDVREKTRVAVSPQRLRRDENESTHHSRLVDDVRKREPKGLPSYLEATSAFNVPKEKDHSRWARAANDRHLYQYNWGSFPDAHPQKCYIEGAPGPGAYGKSTSFCTMLK